MRLTCPNCGAQYEVPDEVIPSDGRDVQCSNCGDTWFQAHPDYPIEAADPEPAPQPDPEPEPQAAAAPDPDPAQDDDPATAYDDDDDDDGTAAHAPTPSRSGIDPDVSDILRQEAEREAQLRAAEAGGLESQGELGLDSGGDDEVARRAREARDRMARIRGEEPAPAVSDADAGSRRGLLPDIEEINSTLRGTADTTAPGKELGPVVAPPEPKRGGSGFSRGFAVVAIFAVVLLLIYANAPKIAQTVPQADPMLSAYVALVDQARLWLDTTVGPLLPQPSE
ncbi:zinc-ribbon domain-containing protein [Seohaeicola saemankumensis]|nr:zinc-ribbon domain-containing protein [Seohaeicola saemankumensis]MCA0870985.1 zinc-ribbon domain-containing protein [Seohaeicola saemankumensis]